MPREKMVFISGIGCSSRFPYYMNTYGFHTIHGRAPTLATGLKVARPDLQVWVITGDGDGLSIGGNHLIHAIRRNVDLKILLFNNEIYGLTKGQYSPTSRLGTRTKSSPQGSVDNPLRPLSLAIGAEATFVARTIDVDINHLTEILQAGRRPQGVGVRRDLPELQDLQRRRLRVRHRQERSRPTTSLYLEHGKPLIFGKDRNKGIRLHGLDPEVVDAGQRHHRRRSADPRREGRGAEPGLPAQPHGLSATSPSASASSAPWNGRPTTSCSTSKSPT